jgi:hypothetical protein
MGAIGAMQPKSHDGCKTISLPRRAVPSWLGLNLLLPPAWLKSKPGTVPDQGNQKVHVSPGDITMTSVGLCPSAALYSSGVPLS